MLTVGFDPVNGGLINKTISLSLQWESGIESEIDSIDESGTFFFYSFKINKILKLVLLFDNMTYIP